MPAGTCKDTIQMCIHISCWKNLFINWCYPTPQICSSGKRAEYRGKLTQVPQEEVIESPKIQHQLPFLLLQSQYIPLQYIPHA